MGVRCESGEGVRRRRDYSGAVKARERGGCGLRDWEGVRKWRVRSDASEVREKGEQTLRVVDSRATGEVAEGSRNRRCQQEGRPLSRNDDQQLSMECQLSETLVKENKTQSNSDSAIFNV